jgi:hypothetical protein
VENLAGGLVLVADTEDVTEGLAVGILDYREVELAAADEVDGGAPVEGFVRRGGPTKAILIEGYVCLMTVAIF